MHGRSSPARRVLLLASLSSLSTLARSFNFTTPLAQCANVTVTWAATGSGSAPYELLLVPLGHVEPVEIRRIADYQGLQGSSFSFPLTYPAGSQFLATLSDARFGPGSGGTSGVLTVANSSDDSCLGTEQVKPEYYFYVNPSTPTQCKNWQISYPTSRPNTTIWGIVPGGPTFPIDVRSHASPSSSPANDGTALECANWEVDLPSGTELLLVAGDASVRNGRGIAGSTDLFKVGRSSDDSCLAQDPSGAASGGGGKGKEGGPEATLSSLVSVMATATEPVANGGQGSSTTGGGSGPTNTPGAASRSLEGASFRPIMIVLVSSLFAPLLLL